MSRQQIKEKLYYDLVLDVDNYNHSVPLLLLLAEFCINNIQFTLRHLLVHILVNFSYLFFQYNYCLITKEVVYVGIDWNSDPINSAMKGLATIIITLAFYTMI